MHYFPNLFYLVQTTLATFLKLTKDWLVTMTMFVSPPPFFYIVVVLPYIDMNQPWVYMCSLC